MIRLIGCVAAAAALALGAVVANGAGAAAPKHNAHDDNIVCNTNSATLRLKPPLINGGTGSLTTTFNGKVNGCSVTDASNDPVSISIDGRITGSISTPSRDCANLLDTVPVTGRLTIDWRSTPRLVNDHSVYLPTSLTPGIFGAQWGGAYPRFDFTGTTNLSFAGGGTASIITNEDVGVVLAGCGTTGAKLLHIGVGQITLG